MSKISSNPLENVKFSRKYSPKKQRVILSHNEMMSVLDAMKAHSSEIAYPFIYCLAHTGAKREEIRTLKWQAVDFEVGFIHFRHTKSGVDRSIQMSASLSSYFQSLPRKGEYIFLNQRGTLLSREQIDDTIASLQKKNPS